MPTIISVAEVVPPFKVKQEQASDFAREVFSHSFKDIDRLLKAFQNGQIEKRYFAKNIDWFKQFPNVESFCFALHLFINRVQPIETYSKYLHIRLYNVS